MTYSERLNVPHHAHEQHSVEALRELVMSWYESEELEFGYKTSGGIAMLELDDIMHICGDKIAPLPEEVIKSLFDKYRGYAELIHQKGEQAVALTRALGSTVLKGYQ